MPKIESKISIEDRGLNFSDGIYEVIFEKAYDDNSVEEKNIPDWFGYMRIDKK